MTLGAGALTVEGAGSTTYSGVISGTGTLTKAGTGTLRLNGLVAKDGTTAEELLKRSDAAMYGAKKGRLGVARHRASSTAAPGTAAVQC